MGANATTSVPTYTSGDVLTAANLNITNSGIPVFADAAARDAAFGGTGEKTLAEGQFAFLESTNATQVYDGSVWVAFGGSLIPSLKWQSGGTYLHPGKWNNNVTANEDATYYMPLFTPESETLDRMQIRTASTFSGSATVRLGLYTAGTDGQPDVLILDAGTVSCTAASTNYSVTISQAVSAGFFFMAFNAQTAAATNTFNGYSNGGGSPEIAAWYAPRSGQNDSFSNLGQQFGYRETGVTGAFTDAGALTNIGTVPAIAVRVA